MNDFNLHNYIRYFYPYFIIRKLKLREDENFTHSCLVAGLK